jgi:single-stranded DNA-binding protein
MTVHAIISGSIFRQPEQRTSKNGRQFSSATIRVRDGDELLFVRVVAFSESVQTELMRLTDGDAVAVQGALKVDTYVASGGARKVSLSLVADHVLALRQPPKERKSKPPEAPAVRSRRERCAGSWQSAADGPNDDIPFGGAL